MQLTLSDKLNNTIDLNFQIRNTLSAQIWAKSLNLAEPEGLRETKRFYNFPEQDCSKLDHLLNLLTKIIKDLNLIHPELIFPSIDRDQLQESVNNLHFNFAHSHHVTNMITVVNSASWGEFNIVLHNIEAVLSNELSLNRTELNNSRIVFTWNNSHKSIIPEECYRDFSLSYEFGTVYANYSQVGRHFYEMFRSQDDQLADEHIQPFRYISADTNIWFGPTSGHAFEKSNIDQIKSWFENRQSRFNRLGYFWGDPKLALGQIPVARLEEPVVSIIDVQNFMNNLANYSKVINVKVT